MTGKDLIKYILDNDLLDKPVIQNGRLVGFLTLEEAAAKFGVGAATVGVWYQLGGIDGVKLGDTIYIPANAEPRIKKSDRINMPRNILAKYIEIHHNY